MTVLVIILRILWSLAAVGIVVSVLLHPAKGDGIAAIGGSAQMFNNKRTAENGLDRVTWAAVLVFLVASTLLSLDWVNTGTPNAPLAPGGQPVAPLPAAPAKPR